MSHPYTTSYHPPAPVLDVSLARRGEASALGPVSAFVDTGADSTFVPQDWLGEMGAPDIDAVRVRGMFGEWHETVLYKIDLIVGGQRLPGVNVVAYEEEAEVVLGRNVLNRLILLLDGPRGLTDLLEQAPRRGG